MPITNYPQGLSSFGVPLIGGGGDAVVTTGNVFFVNSAIGSDSPQDQSGQGTTPTQPFDTISYAIGRCTANNGDVIYVAPGHAEAIASGATLAVNVAGIQIIGLGNRNTRPKITFNGTNSVIAVSAANCSLRNMILQAGIDEVVKAISITAAFCELDRIDVVEVSAKQFIQFVLTSALATDLVIQNCIHHQSTAQAANSLWIQLVAADRALIRNNIFMLTTTSSAVSNVICSTTAAVNIKILDNVIVQLGGTATIPINLVTATSGYVARNLVASAKTAIAGSIALASCYGALNYAGHVVNTQGILDPVVDA